VLDILVILSKQNDTYRLGFAMLEAALSLDLVVGVSHSLYTPSHSLYNFHILAGHDHIVLFAFGTPHRPNPAAAGYWLPLSAFPLLRVVTATRIPCFAGSNRLCVNSYVFLRAQAEDYI
jgi:hypothetical protein